MRTGIPTISYSANLNPGRFVSSLSTFTRIPNDFKAFAIVSAASIISGEGFGIGTITTCVGASFGGNTKPSSSECVIIKPPMRRVEAPQDVAHTYSSLFSLFKNLTSNAFAKFCPKKCDVPACNALPSCIKASIQYVSTAPAKRSFAVLTPLITGIAIQFSAKSA